MTHRLSKAQAQAHAQAPVQTSTFINFSISNNERARGVWTPLKGRYDVRPFRPTSRAPQADFFLATGAPTQTSQFVSIFPFFQVELFAFINARVCWQHGRFGGQPSSTDFCCAIPEPVAAPVVMTVLGFSCVLTRVHRGAPPRPVRHVWELDQHRSA